MLELKPRIYGQTFKWNLLPKNKIDTVLMQPIRNTLKESNVVATKTIDKVTINGQETNLPISVDLTVDSTHKYYSQNDVSTIAWHPTIAKSLVEIYSVQGSTTFTLETPLSKMPTLKVTFNGETSVIDYNKYGHATYLAAIANQPSLAKWIDTYKSHAPQIWSGKSRDNYNRGKYVAETDEDGDVLVDYTKSYVPAYAWVNALYPAGPEDNKNLTPAKNILTRWNDGKYITVKYGWANLYDWKNINSFLNVNVYPSTLKHGDREVTGSRVVSQQLPVENHTAYITFGLIKINDYEYKVNWYIPIRYAYAATSQSWGELFFVPKYTDLESYAFLDRITSLKLDLIAESVDTTEQQISYSLDANNELTQNPKNKNIFYFDKNNLITLNSVWVPDPWTEKMSKYLLTKYKDGAYIVECSVPAKWANENNISINTQMHVYLQDGKQIMRGSTPCVFEVKNIERSYNSDNFVYNLKLMEVK